MTPTPPRVDPSSGIDSDTRRDEPPSIAGRSRARKVSSLAATHLGDPEARAHALGMAAPFSAWPREAVLRLAAASSVASHGDGTYLTTTRQRGDGIIVIVAGTVVSSVTSPGGRRIVFKFDNSSYAYGLFSFVDGLAQGHDLLADGPVTVVRTPHAAILGELQRMPSLWESVAVEATRRARGMNQQMQQFVFDAPMVRAASLLLGMLGKRGIEDQPGPVAIEVRLPQERLAELLGISRQWATRLVRELSKAGLVEWRYGRATVLDVPALRRLSVTGIEAPGQQSGPIAMQWRIDPAPAPVAGARQRIN